MTKGMKVWPSPRVGQEQGLGCQQFAQGLLSIMAPRKCAQSMENIITTITIILTIITYLLEMLGLDLSAMD